MQGAPGLAQCYWLFSKHLTNQVARVDPLAQWTSPANSPNPSQTNLLNTAGRTHCVGLRPAQMPCDSHLHTRLADIREGGHDHLHANVLVFGWGLPHGAGGVGNPGTPVKLQDMTAGECESPDFQQST